MLGPVAGCAVGGYGADRVPVGGAGGEGDVRVGRAGEAAVVQSMPVEGVGPRPQFVARCAGDGIPAEVDGVRVCGRRGQRRRVRGGAGLGVGCAGCRGGEGGQRGEQDGQDEDEVGRVVIFLGAIGREDFGFPPVLGTVGTVWSRSGGLGVGVFGRRGWKASGANRRAGPRTAPPGTEELGCKVGVCYNRGIHEFPLVDQAGAVPPATGFLLFSVCHIFRCA